MLPSPMMMEDTLALRSRLANLVVRVNEARYEIKQIELPLDPEGMRPSGRVTLHGAGHDGRGEFVGWSEDEHQQMAEFVAAFPNRQLKVGNLERGAHSAPVFAAFEAALIDLGLRQSKKGFVPKNGTTDLNYVVSFSETADPYGRCEELRAVYANPSFKVDVSESWTAQTMRRLAARDDIRILDFKERFSAKFAQQIRLEFPNAILEDTPADWSSEGLHAIDKSLLSADDVRAGSFHNIKIPRLGGILATLETIARCQQLDAPFYWGGMYEVGVGRRQAQRLAAVFCPNAHNDLAPLVIPERGFIDSLLRVPEAPGFR